MIQVVLIEDHVALRQALRALLETQPDFRVVGEAGQGLAGIQIIQDCHPDVVITAFGLPDLDGVETARLLERSMPDCAVLLFSLLDEAVYLAYARARGVTRYLSKLVPAEDLFDAIRVARST